MRFAIIASMLVYGQQIATMQARSSDVVSMMRTSGVQVSDNVLKSDSELVTEGTRSGSIRKIATTEEQKRTAATAAWGAARVRKGLQAAEVSLSFDEYQTVLDKLGKLIVTSQPSGAHVMVDGFGWSRTTVAEGYAEEGNRKIVVSLGEKIVRVACDVIRDGVTAVQVNLDAGSGECR